MQAQALQPPKMLDRRGSSFGTSNLTFGGESSYFFQVRGTSSLCGRPLLTPPPRSCCCAILISPRLRVLDLLRVAECNDEAFFLSFNLRSRRVHLVQPNLQQAPRARFHCGVTGRCVVSLPPRELPVVLRKARTISQNKKFFSQPTHSRLRSATQNKPLLLKPPL